MNWQIILTLDNILQGSLYYSPWHLKPVIDVLSVTMNTHLYMAHNGHMSMNCIGIDEISCVGNMVNQPQNGWRDILKGNWSYRRHCFLADAVKQHKRQNEYCLISRSPILGNTRTLYSLSCTLPAAEISSTQPSLSGLWKNLPYHQFISGKETIKDISKS